MSGGVDSSVAAWQLMQQGHQVEGVYMRLWGGERHGNSCSTADGAAAKLAADHLGIPLHVLDFTQEFNTIVVDSHLEALRRGEIGNPCLSCNRSFKIERLFDYARNYDYIATGHYARVVDDAGRAWLARAQDERKDQSYVMWMVSGPMLGWLILPNGELSKTELRQIAADASIPAASTPDSMDLCFDVDVLARERLALHKATLVTTDGREVGELDEMELVSVGQRRGLPPARAGELGLRRYVIDKDVAARRVVIGHTDEIMIRSMVVRDCSFTWEPPAHMAAAAVQVSAHAKTISCRIYAVGKDSLRVVFDHKIRRPSPGQGAVFYQGDRVIGGGTIASAFST